MRFLVRTGPLLGAFMVSGLAFMLIVIVIAQSPYTHGNLEPQGYDRTEIIFVDEERPYNGFPLADPQLASTGDPVIDGGVLFVRYGCASCHGLQGQGAAVGNEIKAEELGVTTLQQLIRLGPRGMPQFLEEILSDEDIEKIFAYLTSVSRNDSEVATAGSVLMGSTSEEGSR